SISAALSIKVDQDDVVYVGGYIGDKAVYWKDGAVTELTDGSTTAMATSIDVSGEDVYIAGVYGDDYENLAYWKNNSSGKVDLAVESPYSVPPILEMLAVFSKPTIQTDGETVYVASPLVENPSEPIFAGGLWKNGVLTVKEGYAYSSLFVRW
ncbi:MAG TPA: hypothetical protein PK443_02620, partial [bacterium]|nr:hypothetical protein [bacterium]